VLFTGPIWLSILIPTLFALLLLMVSLAVRYWGRTAFDKPAWLAVAGLALAFVAGGAWFTAILAAFLLFTHWVALAIEGAPERRSPEAPGGSLPARVWLGVAVVAHVAMVMAIAYTGIVTGWLQGVLRALVPFGVSYFAFHGISYVVDVYRRRAGARRSRSELAVHLLFLPQIVGGPLTSKELTPQVARRSPTVSDYSYGVRRLFIGAWKVFVMAYLAGVHADRVFGRPPNELNAAAAWLGLVSFTIQMYYAFSGYSDMGIGAARMLGIRLPENFRWPYVGETTGEFWQRWHMGLSAWFREYVASPPSASRTSSFPVAREALVVLLCGVWYGVGWTFLVWGAYHAALIVLERAGIGAAVKRLPVLLRHVYLVAAVMAGWVILRSETLGAALLFFAALAGLSPSTVRPEPAIEPVTWLVLAGGAIGCAPLLPTIRRWTVAIDALTTSLLLMLFAVVVFAWRCGGMVATPVLRWGRWSVKRVGR
jgi:alginate O-acetyltransferase complex protein AlgI